MKWGPRHQLALQGDEHQPRGAQRQKCRSQPPKLKVRKHCRGRSAHLSPQNSSPELKNHPGGRSADPSPKSQDAAGMQGPPFTLQDGDGSHQSFATSTSSHSTSTAPTPPTHPPTPKPTPSSCRDLSAASPALPSLRPRTDFGGGGGFCGHQWRKQKVSAIRAQRGRSFSPKTRTSGSWLLKSIKKSPRSALRWSERGEKRKRKENRRGSEGD